MPLTRQKHKGIEDIGLRQDRNAEKSDKEITQKITRKAETSINEVKNKSTGPSHEYGTGVTLAASGAALCVTATAVGLALEGAMAPLSPAFNFVVVVAAIGVVLTIEGLFLSFFEKLGSGK